MEAASRRTLMIVGLLVAAGVIGYVATRADRRSAGDLQETGRVDATGTASSTDAAAESSDQVATGVASPTNGAGSSGASASPAPASTPVAGGPSVGATTSATAGATAGDGVATKPTSPTGWRLQGPDLTAYTLAAESTSAWHGVRSARIDARRAGDESSFGGVLQTVDAMPYRNRRVAFTAYVRTRNAVGATVALGASDSNGVQVSPKFMLSAPSGGPPIKGTVDWTALRVVADIPAQAVTVQYGAFLLGGGTMWVDATSVELARREESATQPPRRVDPYVSDPELVRTRLPRPDNLDFELWD